MNAKFLIILTLLLTLCSVPVIAQEESPYSPAELRQAMLNLMLSIEEAAGLQPKASKGISEISDEVMEEIFYSMTNKEQFITSAQRVVDRIKSAKAALAEREVGALGVGDVEFPPNYPDNANYQLALLFGLVDSPDGRCDGAGLNEYEAVLIGAEETLFYGECACSVAGCDPTGIGCAVVCGAVEVLKAAVHTARIPLDACEAHGGGVDSAEIEAGYENGVTIINDLNNLDAKITNIENKLIQHDGDIKAKLDQQKGMLESALANQQEIIKLLKTPDGRRPDWNQQDW